MVRFTDSECSWPSCAAAQKADYVHRFSPGNKIINTTSVRSSTRHFRDIKITYFHHRITIECHLWDDWICELWHEQTGDLSESMVIFSDGHGKSMVNPLPWPWVLSSTNGWFSMAMLPEGTWQMAIV
jgi:hypothetical protein